MSFEFEMYSMYRKLISLCGYNGLTVAYRVKIHIEVKILDRVVSMLKFTVVNFWNKNKGSSELEHAF